MEAQLKYNLNYVFNASSSEQKEIFCQDIDALFLPRKVDLRSSHDVIFDQGTLGTCVSHSVVYQLRYLMKKVFGISVNMSKLFIHFNGRKLAGIPTNAESGMTMRYGIQSVAVHGAVEETDWPYISSNIFISPPQSLYDKATFYKGMVYFAVSQDLKALRNCLNEGFVVSFGLMIFSSFMTEDVTKDGIVPIPNKKVEQRLGNHAMTIVGYDDDLEMFIVSNSWGKTWGENGFCYVPYALVLDDEVCGDMWTIRVFQNVSPETHALLPLSGAEAEESPEWRPRVQYRKNDKVKHCNTQYLCLVSHTSITVWPPVAVPKVWRMIS